MKPVLLTTKMLTEFLLAFPRNRSGRISPASFIVGVSPTFVSRRNLGNSRWSSIDCYPGRSSITSSRFSVYAYRDDDSDCNNSNNFIEKNENNWLVVGDGDLSYSATIAGGLAKKNVQLFATVLEEESIHNEVYTRSSCNKAVILEYSKLNKSATISNATENTATFSTTATSKSQHQVRFGIDATQLIDYFPSERFKTIEFNFPHWRGKTNAKRNRQLLDSFMGSACKVLHEEGEIIISLCEGQGGFPASTGT